MIQEDKIKGIIEGLATAFDSSNEEMIVSAVKDVFAIFGDREKLPGLRFTAHAVSVATIVSKDLGLDPSSVIAALLHDVPVYAEDSLPKVEEDHGKTVFSLIQGLGKISRIPTDKTETHSENYIKLMLSISGDVRVVLIRLADRLNHLREIERFPEDEKLNLAREMYFLYAPVTHRLGLYHVKTEMDEAAMKVLQPDVYSLIKTKLKASRTKQKVFIDEFKKPIERQLMLNGFDYDMKGRPKSIPSIWSKMKKQNVDFEQVYDLFALRIIINNTLENEKADCWKVYSFVTDIYPPSPERLRDWISAPKRSGYESLHTTVLGPDGRWVEVQIRTARMDEIAEKGIAAHWMYKGGKDGGKLEVWISKIREMLETPGYDPYMLAHNSKMDLYSDKIFIFTPKGDLKKMDSGSTVLDFAYEIHTNIGSRCTGGRINNKNVPIKHQLQNGDIVEILTTKNQKPKTDWLGIVKTSRAKSRIRRALNEIRYKEATEGKEILQRKFKNWKIDFRDENVDKLIKFFKYKNSVDLYYNIATGKIETNKIKEFFLKKDDKTQPTPPARRDVVDLPKEDYDSQDGRDVLKIDDNLDQVNYNLAKCCNPIFGDDVFGFVTVGKGITIHRVNCPNAPSLHKNYDYRVIDVQWRKSSGVSSYLASIKVIGEDELGMVNNISEIISNDMKVNMRSLSFDTTGGKFEGLIVVNVFDTRHLEALLAKLQKIKGIHKASRIK